MQTLEFGYGAKGLAADKLDFSYFSIFSSLLTTDRLAESPDRPRRGEFRRMRGLHEWVLKGSKGQCFRCCRLSEGRHPCQGFRLHDRPKISSVGFRSLIPDPGYVILARVDALQDVLKLG